MNKIKDITLFKEDEDLYIKFFGEKNKEFLVSEQNKNEIYQMLESVKKNTLEDINGEKFKKTKTIKKTIATGTFLTVSGLMMSPLPQLLVITGATGVITVSLVKMMQLKNRYALKRLCSLTNDYKETIEEEIKIEKLKKINR